MCMHQRRDQAVCAVYSGYASLLRNQHSIDRMTDWHSDAGSNTIQVNGAGYDVDTVIERVGEQLCITLGH